MTDTLSSAILTLVELAKQNRDGNTDDIVITPSKNSKNSSNSIHKHKNKTFYISKPEEWTHEEPKMNGFNGLDTYKLIKKIEEDPTTTPAEKKGLIASVIRSPLTLYNYARYGGEDTLKYKRHKLEKENKDIYENKKEYLEALATQKKEQQDIEGLLVELNQIKRNNQELKAAINAFGHVTFGKRGRKMSRKVNRKGLKRSRKISRKVNRKVSKRRP